MLVFLGPFADCFSRFKAVARLRCQASLWLLAGGLAVMLGACSPAMNWRDVRPDDSGLVGQMPCRPASHARDIALGGQTLKLTMHACTAQGQTFAIAWGDVANVAHVEGVLLALKQATLANTAASDQPASMPLSVRGATAQRVAGRWAWRGMLGSRDQGAESVDTQTALFARGTRVVQASVVGRAIQPADADLFLASLHWPP